MDRLDGRVLKKLRSPLCGLNAKRETARQMRLDATKKKMTGEYVEGRTELFNQFKKAAEVTAKMQVRMCPLLVEGLG